MERRNSVSLMSIMLCLFVVFIHVSSEPMGNLSKDSWQYLSVMLPWRGVSFVVPGFIFLSGVKFSFKLNEKMDYRAFYLKKLKYIVAPYVLWTVIYYVYYIHRGYFEFSAKDLLRYIFDGTISGQMYFIIIIVQFYLLAPLWRLLVKRINMVVSLVIAFAITLLTQMLPLLTERELAFNDRMFTSYVIYWVIGLCAGDYNQFSAKLKRAVPVLAVVSAVLLVIDLRLYRLASLGLLYAWYLPGVHVCYCIAAPLLMLGIIECIKPGRLYGTRLFQLADRATFSVYLCHCLILYIADSYLDRFSIGGIGLRYAIRAMTVYITAFTFCIFWQKLKGIIKKHGCRM